MQEVTNNMTQTDRSKSVRRWAAALGTGLFTALALATQMPIGASQTGVDPRIASAVDSVRYDYRLLGNLDPATSVQLTGGANARNDAAVPVDAFAQTNDVPAAPEWSDLFGGENKARETPAANSQKLQVAMADSGLAPLPDSVRDTRPIPEAAPAVRQADAFDQPIEPTREPAGDMGEIVPAPVIIYGQPVSNFRVSSEDTSSPWPESAPVQPMPSETVAPQIIEISAPAMASTAPTTTAPASTAPTTSEAQIIRLNSVTTSPAKPEAKPAQASRSKPRPASFSVVISGLDDNGDVRLMTNRSAAIRTKRSIKTISVAAPDVADVLTLGPDLVLITAKKPGSTQIMLWDESGATASMDVYVAVDLGAINEIIKAAVPGANVTVAAANGAIVLRGEVPDINTAEKLVTLVKPYGTVVNFLEVAGGQQVLLEVQFAEVSRSVVRQLGVNLASQDGISFLGSNIGSAGLFGTTATGANGVGLGVPEQVRSATLFGKADIGGSSIAYLITALKENNLLRVLAKPNIVAMSGQKATFVAGGEIPIPQPSQDGLGITYKEYGVKLAWTPIALGNGKVSMNIEAEVSEIDSSVSVQIGGGPVPGFITRRNSTVAELGDGQTMAIAGMLSSNVVANKQVIPFLGELPVIGALFRSTRYQQRETELLILITPRLVSAMNPGEIVPVPGAQWQDPNDVELYFGGQQGKDVTPRPTRPASNYRRESDAVVIPIESVVPSAPESHRSPRFEPVSDEDRTRHVPFAPQNPGSKVADPLSDASARAPSVTGIDTGLIAPQ